ncbi:MAG: acyl carrier protein [Desulfobacteraceae bacterium]|jgi:acyl carrier protein
MLTDNEDTITNRLVLIIKQYKSDLKNSDELFSSGILDSFTMVEIIVKLENTFHIKIKPNEITLPNLDTIDAMSSFIKKKLNVKDGKAILS